MTASEEAKLLKFSYIYYKTMRVLARLLHPCKQVNFAHDPGDEPAVFVSNHSGISGPCMTTLYYPRPHKTWSISFATDGEHTASYAFHDIFYGNSRKHQGFYRFLSRIMRHALPPLLNYSDTIPVYHDRRVLQTFKQSVAALTNGEDLVIFGEGAERYSTYVNRLQDGFINIGKLYYRRTGKRLYFYPMYVCKETRMISVGEPIAYDPDLEPQKQRKRIVAYLCDQIDALGRAMPEHTPIPFLREQWYRAYGEYEHNFAAYWEMIEQENER